LVVFYIYIYSTSNFSFSHFYFFFPSAGETGAESGGGKVHAIEAVTYSTSDIATETKVVDGAGQRLTLQIENIRGGGGQRRISLFCPYWIVNTTEHALRYKEDKEIDTTGPGMKCNRSEGLRFLLRLFWKETHLYLMIYL
jgi:hypothetical protein